MMATDAEDEVGAPFVQFVPVLQLPVATFQDVVCPQQSGANDTKAAAAIAARFLLPVKRFISVLALVSSTKREAEFYQENGVWQRNSRFLPASPQAITSQYCWRGHRRWGRGQAFGQRPEMQPKRSAGEACQILAPFLHRRAFRQAVAGKMIRQGYSL
jgi:hypothetical protein